MTHELVTPEANGVALKQDSYPELLKKLRAPTPKENIFQRPGGGGTLDYVSLQYVMNRLDEVFTPFGWQFESEVVETLDPAVTGHVVVQGSLTVQGPDGRAVTRMNFGGSQVKISRSTNKCMDLGNDVKSATADALKKCASMFGIASDIYGQNFDKEVAAKKKEAENELKRLRQRIFIAMKGKDVSVDKFREYMFDTFGFESTKEVGEKELIEALKWVESQ